MSEAHLQQGVALYDPEKHRSHAFLYGIDPGVQALSYLAWTLWFLGYPDQALKRVQEALTLAEGLSHPYSLAYVLSYGAFVRYWRGELQQSQESTEAMMAIANEHGFRHWLAWGAI